jgi:hypothetical protein
MAPHERPPDPQPKATSITHTKEKILRAFGELVPLATAEDITRLLFTKGSKAYVRSVMTALAGGADAQKNQYLYRFGMPQAPGNFERLYTLGRRGRAFVRAMGIAVPWCYRPYKARSFSFLQHHRFVTQFIVSLYAFCRICPDLRVRETRNGFAMAANPPRLTMPSDGPDTTITVIPDAWMYLEASSGEDWALWIEIDTGSEGKAKFQQLTLDRINFIRYKGYEAYFGVPAVLLCYLAVGMTTEHRLARLHTIRQWTAEVLAEQNISDWATRFRFSTIDECLYDTLMHLTDPVWYLPDADTLVPLFPSPQEQENTHGTSPTTDLS